MRERRKKQERKNKDQLDYLVTFGHKIQLIWSPIHLSLCILRVLKVGCPPASRLPSLFPARRHRGAWESIQPPRALHGALCPDNTKPTPNRFGDLHTGLAYADVTCPFVFAPKPEGPDNC